MSVLAIGISVFDTTVTMNEDIIVDSKHRVSAHYECAGGQASNAACVLGKWGLKTYMVSRVGKDAGGKCILDTFKNMGVDTSYMNVLDNYTTSSSVIINHAHTGQRTILNYQDPVLDIEYTLPEKIDFLLLDSHEEKIGMDALQKYDVPSMLDAEKVNELTLKYAKEVDYIVASERFAKTFTGLELIEANYQSVIDKIRALNNKRVVVTLGKRGLIYEINGVVKHMDAFKVDVVDTTGAGDIFHGALAYALHEHMDYEKALLFASKTSSISVGRKGGSTSIPDLEEVKI